MEAWNVKTSEIFGIAAENFLALGTRSSNYGQY